MSRVADSTIKGFLYQFNLTALEILGLAYDEDLYVEGIIEDIDIVKSNTVTAIQCKYHESKDKFELSVLYKPILQMLKTFTASKGTESNIKYILYAHFPNENIGEKAISIDDINSILETTNVDYICQYIAYIKECNDPSINVLIAKERKTKEEKEIIKDYFTKNTLNIKCNIDIFLKSYFTLVIGTSYEDLSNQVKEKLCNEGFLAEDINELFYPNTIQMIAETSTRKNANDRLINKEWLINYLRKTKSTAITRWTKELKAYHSLLKARRNQLHVNLNSNRRKRCFIINASEIEDFGNNIVMLINDYIMKYCTKVKLHIPAIFCILGYTKESLDDLIARVYAKDIRYETGYRGNTFFKQAFIRSPEIKQNESWMEFQVKLCIGCKDIYDIISENKPDDIFLLSTVIPDELNLKDINIEQIQVNKVDEIEYLLRLKDEVTI